MSDEFPCRTKTVEEHSYSIKYYDKEDKLVITSYSHVSRETAQKTAEGMVAAGNSIVRFEIAEHYSVRQYCIECGLPG